MYFWASSSNALYVVDLPYLPPVIASSLSSYWINLYSSYGIRSPFLSKTETGGILANISSVYLLPAWSAKTVFDNFFFSAANLSFIPYTLVLLTILYLLVESSFLERELASASAFGDNVGYLEGFWSGVPYL